MFYAALTFSYTPQVSGVEQYGHSLVVEYVGCTDRLSPPRLDKVTKSDC